MTLKSGMKYTPVLGSMLPNSFLIFLYKHRVSIARVCLYLVILFFIGRILKLV